MADTRRTCPVCGYPDLSEPPYDEWAGLPTPEDASPPYQHRFGSPSFEICPSCGFEFGFDDHPGASGMATSFRDHRRRWLAKGCSWWGQQELRPKGWNGREQLSNANLIEDEDP